MESKSKSVTYKAPHMKVLDISTESNTLLTASGSGSLDPGQWGGQFSIPWGGSKKWGSDSK